MAERATKLFHAHESDPVTMGRPETAHDGLRFYTEIVSDPTKSNAAV